MRNLPIKVREFLDSIRPPEQADRTKLYDISGVWVGESKNHPDFGNPEGFPNHYELKFDLMAYWTPYIIKIRGVGEFTPLDGDPSTREPIEIDLTGRLQREILTMTYQHKHGLRSFFGSSILKGGRNKNEIEGRSVGLSSQNMKLLTAQIHAKKI